MSIQYGLRFFNTLCYWAVTEDQQEVSQALRSIRTHYTAMLDLMATEVFKGTLKAYQRTPETLDLLMEHLQETLILDHMKRPIVPSFGDDEDF